MPNQWKKSITAPIYIKRDKLTANNCGISLLSTSHNILSNILLSRLNPFTGAILGSSVWVLM
jgi:hypothetical protein